jgi:hypothetical protein
MMSASACSWRKVTKNRIEVALAARVQNMELDRKSRPTESAQWRPPWDVLGRFVAGMQHEDQRRHLPKRIIQGGFRHIGHGRTAAGPSCGVISIIPGNTRCAMVTASAC